MPTPSSHQSQYPSTFYRVSLKAIIKNSNGEVLVCKEYDADNWSLPGGGWDHGETEHETIARELREEVAYIGDFTYTPFAHEVFWLESKKAWLLWLVVTVTPVNNDFGVGKSCSAVEFINPTTFKNSPHRTEQWIYEHITTSS